MRRSLFPVAGQRVAPSDVATRDPFTALQRELNRAFDDVWRDMGVPGTQLAETIGTPSVDVSEDDTNVNVKAELPGLSEEDVDVTFADGVLRIAGEKTQEKEDQDENRQFYVSERAYGRFERQIPIGREVDEDNIDAAFKNGVLTVTLPKKAKGDGARKISVKRAS
ncbi:heat shock protein Hsp20 [Limimonas halophila]|uniref:Heat shock protein Hsp20 n=1 Tax=Limimonas halophila TaxID=1082479 RepID=A0A1G7U216_9PROT|nr:Hsp20/alpha crystallin family protein [Limimonas halophila]SDG41642.1 heat shock protein Hsp20 [Limimonas halophila]